MKMFARGFQVVPATAFHFSRLGMLIWMATVSVATNAVADNNPGTLEDRSATFDFTEMDAFGVYRLKSGETSSVSGDRFPTRMERRIPLFRLKAGATSTFEAEFRISDAGQTTFAQVKTQPPGPHGNVIFIYAEDDGKNWKIFNDEYRSSDGKRSRKRLLTTIAKSTHINLKLETSYNSDATESSTKITINGRSYGTTKHFQLGSDGFHFRYGAYRAIGSDARVLVRNVSIK